MFKKIFFILLVFTFSFCYAEEQEQEVIQAGIKYNESTARVEAFRDIQRKIDRKTIKNRLKDPNRKENLKAMADSIYDIDFDRMLCPFYYGKTLISYAVTYYDEPLRVYYYNILGNLVKFEIVESGYYPKRTFAYSRFGNLLSVNFDIDGSEQFMYEDDGKLIAHWIDEKYVGKHTILSNITRGKNPKEKVKSSDEKERK